jgi:hypothetical protein
MRILSFSDGVAKRELKKFRKHGISNYDITINSNNLNQYDAKCNEYILYTQIIEENRKFKEILSIQHDYKIRFIIFGITNKYRESSCIISNIIQEVELIKFKEKKKYTPSDKFKLSKVNLYKDKIIDSLTKEQKKIAHYIHVYKNLHSEHLWVLEQRLLKIKSFIDYFLKM